MTKRQNRHTQKGFAQKGLGQNGFLHRGVIAAVLLAGLLAVALLPASARADEISALELRAAYAAEASSLASVRVSKAYVLGINRFDLDEHTEILGWQLANSWYLGRQDGLDSGLTLVWQQDANQFSVSKDGLRLTRRF